MTNQLRDQRGVVSIFIVIFSAILMAVVTLSFLSLMIHDQQRATDNQLSQSAYDAAMTGVEDAKRAIAICQKDPKHAGCSQIASQDCVSTIQGVLGPAVQATTRDDGNKEFLIQQPEGARSETENTLNQAYTCLTIDPTPVDYHVDQAADMPIVIPLQTSGDPLTGGVTLSWKPSISGAATKLPSTGRLDLQPFATWNGNSYPPLMRVELIRGLSDPSAQPSVSSNTKSVAFVYPGAGRAGALDMNIDNHNTPNTPALGGCQKNGTSYECSITIKDANKDMSGSYLVLTPIYSGASVTLTLNGAKFGSYIQSVVDSTGRADDLFRRVRARVNLSPATVYPNAALTLNGPLCKNFAVAPNYYKSSTTASTCSGY